MDTLGYIQWLGWGLVAAVLCGLAGALLWSLKSRRRRAIRFRGAVTCLLCGRRNRITPEEWARSRVICRCGQPLYLASPPSTQEHPPRR